MKEGGDLEADDSESGGSALEGRNEKSEWVAEATGDGRVEEMYEGLFRADLSSWLSVDVILLNHFLDLPRHPVHKLRLPSPDSVPYRADNRDRLFFSAFSVCLLRFSSAFSLI
jgi:hypothetical protein